MLDDAVLRWLAVDVEKQIDEHLMFPEASDLDTLRELLSRPAFVRDGDAPC